MAFIKHFERKDTTPRKLLHRESKGSYSTFEHHGRKFIQIVSYGTRNPLKITQTTQFDRDGALQLYKVLKRPSPQYGPET